MMDVLTVSYILDSSKDMQYKLDNRLLKAREIPKGKQKIKKKERNKCVHKMVSERVPTGIEALDRILGGGLLRGNIVLLAGHPGAGKTTFGALFLYHGAVKYGEPGVYVSFTESKREFYTHMKQLGLDFEILENEGKFRFVEGLTGISKETFSPMINVIGDMIDEINAKRVVLDPITALLMHFSENEARVFFREALTRLFKPLGITTYFIADLPVGREVIGFGFEEFLADVVMRLQYEEVGPRLPRRLLVIQKSRYTPVPRYSYEFEIGKGGVTVFEPLEEVPRGSFTLSRVKTGIPELDEMLGGGLLKNSLTILSGPSGTGKTMLALRFAVEGALRGEKVVYLSFEETPEQLQTVLKSMGYDVNKLAENLVIGFHSPRITTPGEMMTILKEAIRKHKPARLLLDSLSALKKQYDPISFMDAIRMLGALCKINNVTAVFLTLEDLLSGEAIGFSTIADTLIALSFERKGNEFRRVLAVLKMRGSSHDRRIKVLEFQRERVRLHGANE